MEATTIVMIWRGGWGTYEVMTAAELVEVDYPDVLAAVEEGTPMGGLTWDRATDNPSEGELLELMTPEKLNTWWVLEHLFFIEPTPANQVDLDLVDSHPDDVVVWEQYGKKRHMTLKRIVAVDYWKLGCIVTDRLGSESWSYYDPVEESLLEMTTGTDLADLLDDPNVKVYRHPNNNNNN